MSSLTQEALFKFHVMSDLHWEFHRDYGYEFCQSLPITNADYLLLVGDIGLFKDFEKMLQSLRIIAPRYKKVFYIFGNHEYYNLSLKEKQDLLNKNNIDNLEILDDRCVPLDHGYKIAGATLWFPFQEENEWYARMLNDFHCIENFRRWVYFNHDKTKQWLNEVCDDKTILMTHHLPCQQSIIKKYKGNPLNRFYFGDIEQILQDKKIPLAVHGHTHVSLDYKFHDTRVVCNAFGYQNQEENPDFDPKLVLTV